MRNLQRAMLWAKENPGKNLRFITPDGNYDMVFSAYESTKSKERCMVIIDDYHKISESQKSSVDKHYNNFLDRYNQNNPPKVLPKTPISLNE